MSASPNFLAVETQLIGRIAAQMGGEIERVGGIVDHFRTVEADGPYPSVFVAFVGFAGGSSTHSARAILPLQRWRVFLLTRQSIDAGTAQVDFNQPGELLHALYAALSGWRPDGRFQVAEPIFDAGVPAVDYQPGYTQYLLEFQIGVPMNLGALAA